MAFALRIFRFFNVVMLAAMAFLAAIFGLILSFFTGLWGVVELSGQVMARTNSLVSGQTDWLSYYSIGDFLNQSNNAPFFVAFARSEGVISQTVQSLPHEGYAIMMIAFGLVVLRLIWRTFRWTALQMKSELKRLKPSG